MELDQLFVYPLKSARGIAVSEIRVQRSGFFKDRAFAVMGKDNKIMTAREKPELLRINASVNGDILKLSSEGKEEIQLNYSESFHEKTETSLFKMPAHALITPHIVNEWLSQRLQEPCRLVAVNRQKPRLSTKTIDEIPINFSDSCPVHLISISSLTDLNKRLQKPVKIDRFRPNIVVSGTKAYDEENWKKIQIGNCLFKVVTTTKRCTVVTIDPQTQKIDKNQQPLRELSTYKNEDGGVHFGIYLVPITTGTIKMIDEVIVNP